VKVHGTHLMQKMEAPSLPELNRTADMLKGGAGRAAMLLSRP